MASKYVKELKDLASTLRKEGWELRAGIALSAAMRMDALEKLIVSQKDSFGDGT